MANLIPISQGKGNELWTRMTMYLHRHNKFVKEGRSDIAIIQYYWICIGMLEAAKVLDLFDANQLKQYEHKLYKYYEK